MLKESVAAVKVLLHKEISAIYVDLVDIIKDKYGKSNTGK